MKFWGTPSLPIVSHSRSWETDPKALRKSSHRIRRCLLFLLLELQRRDSSSSWDYRGETPPPPLGITEERLLLLLLELQRRDSSSSWDYRGETPPPPLGITEERLLLLLGQRRDSSSSSWDYRGETPPPLGITEERLHDKAMLCTPIRRR